MGTYSNFIRANTALPAAKATHPDRLKLRDMLQAADPTHNFFIEDLNDLWDAAAATRTEVRGREFNVKHYGAVGDGSTDDTTALQAALTAAGAAGSGEVFLPPGTYIFTPSLTIPTGVTLRGTGPGSVLKVKANAGNYDKALIVSSTANVRLLSFRLDQNSAGNTTCDVSAGVVGRRQYGVYGWTCTGLVVEGCTFDYCGVNAITVGYDGEVNARIVGNRFAFDRAASTEADGTNHAVGLYDNSAIYVEGAGQVIQGNVFSAAISERALGAIETHGGRSVVSGNVATGYETLCNVVSSQASYTELNPNGITVTGNTLVDGRLGITLWSITGRPLRGVTVSGNTLSLANASRSSAGLWYGDHTYGVGLNGQSSFEDITIAGNTITFQAEDRALVDDSVNAGISLQSGTALDSIVVRGNTILDAPKHGVRVHVRSGGTANRVYVHDNVMVDAGQNNVGFSGFRTGLFLAGVVKNSEFCRNRIIDTGTNGSFALSFYLDATSSNLRVEDNVKSSVLSIDTNSGAGVSGVVGRNAAGRLALTYSASLSVDVHDGVDHAVVTATNSTAFTFNAPSLPLPGFRLRVTVRNASGGALGALTWASAFKLATWTQPANGFSRSIDFAFDGTNWVEQSRTPADVPN